MDKITIKNISNATVSLFVPEAKLNRELVPGREIAVDKDTYDELTFDTGFNALVRSHYLFVSGVGEDDQVEAAAATNIYDRDRIAKMLDEGNITEFAKFIPTAAPAEKDVVIDLAVEKGITNSGFVTLIRKYCGKDVIELINTRHGEEI